MIHNENDHKVNIFKCEDCNAIFKNDNNIRKHKRAHSSNSFCHTFNNFPKCQYGNSCLFLHIEAPYCAFDGRCSRPSCQYRHKYGCLEKNRFVGNNFMKKKLNDKNERKNDANFNKQKEKNEEKI